MTDAELHELIESIHAPGWSITYDGDVVTVRPDPLPFDRDDPAVRLTDSFQETLPITAAWDRDAIVCSIFAVLQFRTDHELREHFLVDGVRVFDAHRLGVTGEQHDWFVERQSAVRGY